MALSVTLLNVFLVVLTTSCWATPAEARRLSAGAAARGHHGRHHHDACAEPLDLGRRFGELKAGHVTSGLHDSFYMLPFLREASARLATRFDFVPDDRAALTTFNGSAECPTLEDDVSAGDRDPCPTYHVINTDSNRFPKVIMETRCRNCSRCQGLSPRVLGNPPLLHIPSCEGVLYHTRVLRKTGGRCRDGLYQYAPTWEKVRVGCACKLVPVL